MDNGRHLSAWNPRSFYEKYTEDWLSGNGGDFSDLLRILGNPEVLAQSSNVTFLQS